MATYVHACTYTIQYDTLYIPWTITMLVVELSPRSFLATHSNMVPLSASVNVTLAFRSNCCWLSVMARITRVPLLTETNSMEVGGGIAFIEQVISVVTPAVSLTLKNCC